MTHTACLGENVSSGSSCSKIIGTYSWYIDPAHMTCLGRLFIDAASLPCLVNMSALVCIGQTTFLRYLCPNP